MMNPRQWFQTRLKWAGMGNAQELIHWRETKHFFSVKTGRRFSKSHTDLATNNNTCSLPRRVATKRRTTAGLPEVVYQPEPGMGGPFFEVDLGIRRQRNGWD